MPGVLVRLDNMNIFWGDPHLNLTKRVSQAFNALGHTIVLPSPDYKITHYGFTRPDWIWSTSWSKDFCKKHIKYGNYLSLNKEEILDLKPDVIFIVNFEAQFEVIHELLPKLPKSTKLAFYSGNQYTAPYSYPFWMVKNYLYTDFNSDQEVKTHQIPNALKYRVFTPYDVFSYKPYTGNKNIIGNYTCNFEKDWKNGWEFSKACELACPEAKFEYNSKLSESEVAESIANTLATTSFKEKEGFGMAQIEAMARGRPAFLIRQFSQDKTYTEWSIEGETAFYVSSVQEFRAKLKALIDSKDFRDWTHWNCAQKIREYIDNCSETEKLGKFLENLQ